MNKYTNKEMIDSLEYYEQIEFYKKHFQYQHCQNNDCGRELGEKWILWGGDLYCESCFDWLKELEKDNIQNEISKKLKEIDELRNKYNSL